MTAAANPLDAFIKRYGPLAGVNGPMRLVMEVFGATPDSWQREVLKAFGGGERRISVRSAHGVGKTALASWLVWVMLLSRFPQKTVATAPTQGQLQGALLPEIKSWGQKLPEPLRKLYDVKSEGIYYRPAPHDSYFEARTARIDNPEALQGVHSEHTLLICDEASGVPEAVYEAGSGSMSGHNATTLLIGNPVRLTGLFYDTHHKLRDMWRTIKVGHADSKRIDPDFVRDIARRYGEDSNAFRIRCLGEFPKSEGNVVIPFEWVEAALERDIEDKPGAQKVWGLDVARGGDRNALVERTNRTGRILDAWTDTDTMTIVGRVKARYDGLGLSQRPTSILVDVIGLGGPVVDRMRELGLPVRGVNVAESAALNERFNRARSELWWRCREWLEKKDVRLIRNDASAPWHEELVEELIAPTYKFTSTGKIQIEPKEKTKETIKRSPDLADALVLTFAEDLSAAVHGSRDGMSWSKPLKRGMVVV